MVNQNVGRLAREEYYVFGQHRTDGGRGLKISIVAGRPLWMPLDAIAHKLAKPQSSHLGKTKDFYHIEMFVWPRNRLRRFLLWPR